MRKIKSLRQTLLPRNKTLPPMGPKALCDLIPNHSRDTLPEFCPCYIGSL